VRPVLASLGDRYRFTRGWLGYFSLNIESLGSEPWEKVVNSQLTKMIDFVETVAGPKSVFFFGMGRSALVISPTGARRRTSSHLA